MRGAEYWLEKLASPDRIPRMSKPSAQPVPNNLREQMIQRLQTAPAEEVIFVHEALLHAEKERLWKEIQQDATAERAAGKLDHIPEAVRAFLVRRKATA